MTVSLTVNLILVVLTSLISIQALNNSDFKSKLIFSPYAVKHRKEYWRIFSHAFIHADYTHLIFNMIALYFLGNVVESILVGIFELKGYIYYILLYLVAIPASSIPAMYKHGEDPNYLSLGASGAVSAVVFAAIIMAPLIDLYLLFIPIPIKGFIFGFLYLLFETYASKNSVMNIAHDAHIAGAIFGVLFITFIDYRFFISFFQQVNLWIQSIF